jgi:hypothetical protein
VHMKQELRRIGLRLRILQQVLGEQRQLRPPAYELRSRSLPDQLTA